MGFALADRDPVTRPLRRRDNLALNIIQLIHPFESILRWQQGG